MARLFLLALLLLIAAPAAAKDGGQEAKLREISERGRLIFEVDRAAWVTTDDMREREPAARQWPIKGWVVERDGDTPHAYVVTYFGGDGSDGLAAWYVGKVRDNRVTSGEVFGADRRPPLTAGQQLIVRARSAAIEDADKAGFRPCTPARFNVTILPPAAPDAPVDVYLLSPQVESGTYPAGGHFLVRVGADGQVLSHRKFTNGCIPLSTAPPPGAGSTAALMVTHLLDPLPTEIHAFLSIWMEVPLAVGIDGKAYWLEKGEIRPLGR